MGAQGVDADGEGVGGRPFRAPSRAASEVDDLLNTAGLYQGIDAGSSENMFARIDADCDVAGFSGANNSNSIRQNGGANLFDHAAVSFVDGGGTAHVMILDGDDADDPGSKQAGVWVY